jgi:hypothetical protein
LYFTVKVSIDKGKRFAEEIDAMYIETISKTGSNIHLQYKRFQNKFVEDIYPALEQM